jgi:uncharacterized RDD family membrane protein YckC
VHRDDKKPVLRRTCQITGETLQPDEAIFFRGRWVGAKGKQILLDRIMSGEEDDLVTAGMMQLFKAFCLDWATLATLILMFMIAMAVAWQLIVVGAFVLWVIITGYFGFQVGRAGGTWGERAVGIRIVRRDGGRITMRQGIMRAIYYTMPMLLVVMIGPMVILGKVIHDPGLVALGAMMFLAAAALWPVVDFICMLFDFAQRRSLHDRLAGTRAVVRDSQLHDASESDDGPYDDGSTDYDEVL